MNISQLKTFCTVARTLSFTKAAEELMISQPAVSKQIAALEEEISALLFARNRNTLELTGAGIELYRRLPEKMAELDALFFSTHLISLGKIKRIKIGLLRNQCMDKKLLNVVRNMRDENYFVNLQEYDFKGIERALYLQDIDVAVCIRWAPSAFSDCESFKLSCESLCLALNREYSPELPQELNEEALTDFSRVRPTMIPELSSFERSQYSAIAKRTEGFWKGVREEPVDMIVPMVKSGIGSAIVNETHILSENPAVDMRKIPFLQPVEKSIFWKSGCYTDAAKDFVARMQ